MFNIINVWFLNIIRYFDSNINQVIRDLTVDFKLQSFIILLLTAFIYGVLHSAGPGHGKTIVATYFFKEKHPIIKSISLSALISTIHTLTAIILALLLSFVFTGIRGLFRIKLQSYFIFSSGSMILLLALTFLIIKLINFKKGHKHSVEFKKNMFFTGLSAGIIPCPVSMMVMLFTISNGIPVIGLAVVLSSSLGMFLLLSIIGILSISSRNQLISFSDKKLKKTEIIAEIVEFISIFLMFLIGFAMTYKTFSVIF